ncbi:MAG: hypothetical protein OEW65_04910 [Thermoleophilia bacterium]|nr:hypothetical protein [Thermoleophilia bacterium]
MPYRKRLIPLILVGAALSVAGCGGDDSAPGDAATGPATIYEVDGSDLSRIELTAKAAERLDIQTAAVEASGKGMVIPYSALLYAPTGETWVYVSPKPLTFVREEIVVESIAGDRAFLSSGPAPGTKVATVGVAELSGAEAGLGQ